MRNLLNDPDETRQDRGAPSTPRTPHGLPDSLGYFDQAPATRDVAAVKPASGSGFGGADT